MNVLIFHLSNIGALLFYFCALVGCLMHPPWKSLLLADEIVVRGVGPGVEGAAYVSQTCGPATHY